MPDPRYDVLAKNLIGFSVSLKKGERILIDAPASSATHNESSYYVAIREAGNAAGRVIRKNGMGHGQGNLELCLCQQRATLD